MAEKTRFSAFREPFSGLTSANRARCHKSKVGEHKILLYKSASYFAVNADYKGNFAHFRFLPFLCSNSSPDRKVILD